MNTCENLRRPVTRACRNILWFHSTTGLQNKNPHSILGNKSCEYVQRYCNYSLSLVLKLEFKSFLKVNSRCSRKEQSLQKNWCCLCAVLREISSLWKGASSAFLRVYLFLKIIQKSRCFPFLDKEHCPMIYNIIWDTIHRILSQLIFFISHNSILLNFCSTT